MFILGLTGSIGMGKSTTAAMFRAEGIPVHDADAVVHELYQGEAVPAIEAAFPGTTRDGIVDRRLLSAQLLNDPAALDSARGDRPSAGGRAAHRLPGESAKRGGKARRS